MDRALKASLRLRRMFVYRLGRESGGCDTFGILVSMRYSLWLSSLG